MDFYMDTIWTNDNSAQSGPCWCPPELRLGELSETSFAQTLQEDRARQGFCHNILKCYSITVTAEGESAHPQNPPVRRHSGLRPVKSRRFHGG